MRVNDEMIWKGLRLRRYDMRLYDEMMWKESTSTTSRHASLRGDDMEGSLRLLGHADRGGLMLLTRNILC